MIVRLLRQNRIDGNAGDMVDVSPARAAFLLGLNLAEPAENQVRETPEGKKAGKAEPNRETPEAETAAKEKPEAAARQTAKRTGKKTK